MGMVCMPGFSDGSHSPQWLLGECTGDNTDPGRHQKKRSEIIY